MEQLLEFAPLLNLVSLVLVPLLVRIVRALDKIPEHGKRIARLEQQCFGIEPLTEDR